jgi:phosphopantothenoylcysteine decarboxylase/phosphopantothenate--cysteine ligase
MLHNPITQDNLEILKHYGFEIIEPATGMLACRDVGEGKLPDTDVLLNYLLKTIAFEKDMEGLNVLVTAGPTQEALDPVRYITNHSSGKMGYAIARNAMLRGANVTLVTGQTSIEKPMFVDVVEIESASDMFEAVTSRADKQDIIIKAAAVADYTPSAYSEDKMKKSEGDMYIPLERTQDILKYLGEHKKSGQFLCGFSMETKDMLENSRKKLIHKNLDMIVANNLKVEGAGFGVDTNVITMIMPGTEIALEMMSKDEVAEQILDQIIRQRI